MGGGGGTGVGGGAPTFAITFSDSCPTLGTCGGNIDGGWTYQSACINKSNPWPVMKSVCSGVSFSDLSGTMSGTLDVSATHMTFNTELTIAAKMDLPAACLPSPPSQFSCAGVQLILLGTLTGTPLVKTASCSVGADAGSCVCSVTDERKLPGTAASSYSGSTLTTTGSDGGVRTYGYCVSGGTLTYQETSATPLDSAIYTLK